MPAIAPVLRILRDDLVQIRVQQRFAAGDRDDGGAEASQVVDASQHLVERHGIRKVVVFVAVGAGEVAAAHRHNVRHIRVPGGHHGRPDRTQLTQLARHCLPAALSRHRTSAIRHGSFRSRRHITFKYIESLRLRTRFV